MNRNAIKDHQLRREGCCSHLLNEIFQYIAIWNSFKLEIIYQYFKNITTQDKGPFLFLYILNEML